jgi:hypothetical protein
LEYGEDGVSHGLAFAVAGGVANID